MGLGVGGVQLGQWVIRAVGRCAGAPTSQASSGQLDVKGCASSRGVVWGFCIVVVFSSGCDALCFLGEG